MIEEKNVNGRFHREIDYERIKDWPRITGWAYSEPDKTESRPIQCTPVIKQFDMSQVKEEVCLRLPKNTMGYKGEL